jgi:hypothetical protein
MTEEQPLFHRHQRIDSLDLSEVTGRSRSPVRSFMALSNLVVDKYLRVAH